LPLGFKWPLSSYKADHSAPHLYLIQHSSGNKKAEEDANKEAEIKVQDITEAGRGKGDQVVDDLIHAVMDVRPEAPQKIIGKV
jgi:hypothetical protein